MLPPKTTSNISNIAISFDNSIIPLQNHVKYFGIRIDPRLKFNSHIKTLESKITTEGLLGLFQN